MNLAAIVSGHDADIWFLIAMILLVVAAVICVADKVWVTALAYTGLAFVALAFLVT